MAQPRPTEHANVYVTVHAQERFEQRVLSGKAIPRGTVLRTIVAEFRAALENQRRATRKPGWCSREGVRLGRRREGHVRYLWDENESFCMVASLSRQVWVIHTVLDRKS